MIKGRLSFYMALMNMFDEGQEFTLQEAVTIQRWNIYPFVDEWIVSNVGTRLASFIVEGRVVRVRKGIYKLTPRYIDYERALLAERKEPRIVYIKGQTNEVEVVKIT